MKLPHHAAFSSAVLIATAVQLSQDLCQMFVTRVSVDEGWGLCFHQSGHSADAGLSSGPK